VAKTLLMCDISPSFLRLTRGFSRSGYWTM